VIEFQDPEYERLMQTMAERLGFDLVSFRLELFGRRSAVAQAAQNKGARPRDSRSARVEPSGTEVTMVHGRAAR
jgi:Fur family transcriptional regulator, ferric uptake regulator